MFESTLLDKLSRVHPTVPLYIFVPAIVVLFTLGARELTTLGTLGLVAGGYFFWTLTEYWMHRLVFHFEPEEGLGARLHWIIHGVHHDHPNDPAAAGHAAVGERAAGADLLRAVRDRAARPPRRTCSRPASSPGYLVYDMLHYHVHHHRPRTRLGKLMRELHMRHHFQDDTRGFGVSAPFWDRVFGTSQRRSAERR